MRSTVQKLRLGVLAAGAVLSCAAMAQTPAPSAPMVVGTPNAVPSDGKVPTPLDSISAYRAMKEAAHRNEVLEAAKKIAAAPVAVGSVEKEGATPAPASIQKAEGGKVDQGVQVHGHWVIDVKNPDGTLAGHHDFQNSLQLGGGFLLGGMLNSELVPANWMISLGGSPLICGGGSSGICGIVQSQTTQPAASSCAGGVGMCVTGLTTTFNYSTFPVSLTLAGSFTATQNGNVNQVATILGFCVTAPGTTFSPQSCATGAPSGSSDVIFSATPITAIPVTSGQIVQVTVTFSFS